MTFALRPGIDLGEEIRRVSLEQTACAIAEISGTDAQQRGIHKARKCLKRLRALLRFARPAMASKEFTEHDQRLRNIGRTLSASRDCQAMVESLEKLQEHFGGGWNSRLLGGLRATFQGRQQREVIAMAQLTKETTGALGDAREGFEGLVFDSGKLSVSAGAKPVYARARKGLKHAFANGHADAFHAWRRDAQRHWRHMQLLAAAWPEEMSARITEIRALSQCLGDDHDIHILMGHVRTIGPDLASRREMESFYDGCALRQHRLRFDAHNHGRLLFTEAPSAFARRIGGYWAAATDRHTQEAGFEGGSATTSQESKVVPIQSAQAENGEQKPPALIPD